MKCARHPNVETNLECGKCGTPICPKCFVQTPVGARCPDCAKLTRLPTFQVSALDYLKAVGVGLGIALGLGTIWGFISPYLWFFSYLVILLIGWAIGEIMSLSVNKKRGVGLQIIGGICTFISYVMASFVIGGFYFFSLYGLLALAAGIFITTSRLR